MDINRIEACGLWLLIIISGRNKGCGLWLLIVINRRSKRCRMMRC